MHPAGPPDPRTPIERALAHVAALGEGPPLNRSLRVNLHFHPDRLFHGEPILAAMARAGVYRSQFETGTSNGGLTARPGGDRWAWESRIFGGAYDGADPRERPKYGALNARRRSTGASPRFGSAHLRLAEPTLDRTTFCFPDSFYQPRHFGTADRMGLLPHAAAHDGDPLDGYIEAHVHGVVRLDADVEALVLDPCYRATPTGDLAERLGVPVEWHAGFRVGCDVVRRHPSYRGQEFVDLALAIAPGGVLTPAVIGDASRTGRHDEQALKRVWHYLARFGDSGLGDGAA